jgi:hypothetical protein
MGRPPPPCKRGIAAKGCAPVWTASYCDRRTPVWRTAGRGLRPTPSVVRLGESRGQHRDSTDSRISPIPAHPTYGGMRDPTNHADSIGPAWTRTHLLIGGSCRRGQHRTSTCVYVSAVIDSLRWPTKRAISAQLRPCRWSSEIRRWRRSCGENPARRARGKRGRSPCAADRRSRARANGTRTDNRASPVPFRPATAANLGACSGGHGS